MHSKVAVIINQTVSFYQQYTYQIWSACALVVILVLGLCISLFYLSLIHIFNGMTFYELPYCDVDSFDYQGIARMVEEDGADIIWVALGAVSYTHLDVYKRQGLFLTLPSIIKLLL